jgi:hypothetical protein
MKKLMLIIFLTTIVSMNSHATGFVTIYCESQNSRIVIGHSGYKESMNVQRLIFGVGFPHPPISKYRIFGNNVSIVEDGVDFILIGVFGDAEPSYPTPTFEIRSTEYPFPVIENGSCKIH